MRLDELTKEMSVDWEKSHKDLALEHINIKRLGNGDSISKGD